MDRTYQSRAVMYSQLLVVLRLKNRKSLLEYQNIKQQDTINPNDIFM